MTIEEALHDLGVAPFEAFVGEPHEIRGDEAFYTIKGGYLLLIVPYRPIQVEETGVAFCDTYYPAHQRAYHTKLEIKKALTELCLYCTDFKGEYKPLFARLGVGKIAKNTLLLLPAIGSFCAIEVLVIEKDAKEPTGAITLCEACASCDRCVRLCPMKALEGGSFIRERCIRDLQFYPLSQETDAEKRKTLRNKVMGCNICQISCPQNLRLRKEIDGPDQDYRKWFDLDVLALGCIAAGKEREFYAAYFGKNFMRPRRVLSHVLNAMENDRANIKRHYGFMKEYEGRVTDNAVRSLINDYLARWEKEYALNAP